MKQCGVDNVFTICLCIFLCVCAICATVSLMYEKHLEYTKPVVNNIEVKNGK